MFDGTLLMILGLCVVGIGGWGLVLALLCSGLQAHSGLYFLPDWTYPVLFVVLLFGSATMLYGSYLFRKEEAKCEGCPFNIANDKQLTERRAKKLSRRLRKKKQQQLLRLQK